MFPTKTVKEEISNENNETNELNNKEIKIEVKMEEVDPIAVTSFDNDPLNLDNVKMEANEIDYEALYVKVKDEFDSEIVEQELENNDEIINKPVMIGDPEVEPSSSSKKLILLPKAVFLDMKAKTKSEEMKTLLSQFLEEREALLLKNAELRNEMGLLKNKNSRHRRNIQILNQKVALFENRAKSSDTRLKEANLVNKQLQSKVDELQTHICLLSTSNSKLKGDLERRLRGKDKLKLLTTRPEVESNNDKMFTENREPTEKDLKDTVISLVKENNIVKRQLNTKIEELKKTQEKYGQTMMALSKERRKTEELMQNAPPKKKKIETLVEKVRR